MKRFYCTICKRVKRVRTLPRITDTHSSVPSNRIGQCDRHTDGRIHPHREGPLPTNIRNIHIKSSAPAVSKQAQRQNHKQSSKGVK